MGMDAATKQQACRRARVQATIERLENRTHFTLTTPQISTAVQVGFGVVGEQQLGNTIVWNNVDPADQYRLQFRRHGFGLSWPSDTAGLIEQDPGPTSVVTSITRDHFGENSGQDAGQKLEYRVRAEQLDGQGAIVDTSNWSNTVSPISGIDYSLRPHATLVQGGVMLGWTLTTEAGYTPVATDIYRKAPGDTTWGTPVASIAVPYSSWTDSNFASGAVWEYQIITRPSISTTSGDHFAYIKVARQGPLVESRGTVLLVVDQTLASGLSSSLTQFKQDLIGDGWQVRRLADVPRDADEVTSRPYVQTIRASIKSVYDELANTSSPVKQVILVGHVPVPYSGLATAFDGHSDHQGAWPADVYYGDMAVDSPGWTDEDAVSNTARPANNNAQGDGKFDQSYIPGAGSSGKTELAVGRIDVSRLASGFGSELQAMQRYFQKDHDFRHSITPADRVALIDDNVGYAIAGHAWATASALFGPMSADVDNENWLTYAGGSGATRKNYLFSYGASSGADDSAIWVLNSASLAATTDDSKWRSVFNQFFGSYFADWNTQNNLLRSTIAARGTTLTATWGNRPDNFIYPMAVGDTIGDGLVKTINGPSFSSSGGLRNGIHIALIGDPTLRLHIVAPVSDVFVDSYIYTPGVYANTITWTESPDPAVVGYNVYIANSTDGPFTKVNTSLITGTGYGHETTSSSAVYMVKAVKLEDTPSGTYYNASTGILAQSYGGGGEMMMASGGGGGSASGLAAFSSASSFGPSAVRIFDDLFGSTSLLGGESASSMGMSASSATSLASVSGLYTGNMLEFNFSFGSGGSREIDVTLAGGTGGRRVELFDATMRKLITRRDVNSIGSGGTMRINGIAAGANVIVRVRGINASGPVSAGAVGR